MMRISHTCRSRSPVTHPKTPVDSTPRPITAAAPRKRAPTHHYKSHPSYSSHHWLLLTKPPLSRFLQGLGFYSASPKLCGKADRQGARPRSCGRTPCLSATPPSAARRPATTSTSPWARVAAVVGIIIFLLALTPLRHLPGAATCYLESLYFSESLMKGRRALPTA